MTTELIECARLTGIIMARVEANLDDALEVSEYEYEPTILRDAFRDGFMSVHRSEFLSDY